MLRSWRRFERILRNSCRFVPFVVAFNSIEVKVRSLRSLKILARFCR